MYYVWLKTHYLQNAKHQSKIPLFTVLNIAVAKIIEENNLYKQKKKTIQK